MYKYLITQDALNVDVSCTRNYFTHDNPRTVNLWNWLHSKKYLNDIVSIRREPDKIKRDGMKAKIPAITPSGTFTHVEAKSLVKHSGLIQFDIDVKDNPLITDFNALKTEIGKKLPFVAYCGLSASGKGVWGLVPIAQPERHTQCFTAIELVFKEELDITLDPRPKNVASFRGYSYDPAPYMPQRVMLFEWVHNPQKPPKATNFEQNGTDDQNRVEHCINELTRRGLFLGDSYESWYTIGCGLAKTFGESGREYFLAISAYYPGTHKIDPNKQFTHCLKAKSKATLGSFFRECKLIGIEWKDALTAKPKRSRTQVAPDKRQPPAPPTETSPAIVTTVDEQLASPGATLRPDASQIERLPAAPADTYPAEWDQPNPPDAVPTIRPLTFHQWQKQHSHFGQMGINSIQRTA